MDIQIPAGVSRGATPNDRAGRWYDSNLIRWRDGKLQPIGGWERITASPLSSPVRKILPFRDNSDITYLAIGSDENIYLNTGGANTDITPTSGYVGLASDDGLTTGWSVSGYGAGGWGVDRSPGTSTFLRAQSISMDTWGEDLVVLASTDGTPLIWSPQTPSTPLTRIPSQQIIAVTIVDHGSGLTDGVQTFTVTGGTYSAPCTFTATVTGGEVQAGTIVITNAGNYTADPSWVANAATVGVGFTNATFNLTGSIPLNNRAMIVTAERHLMLIGYGGDPKAIAWSSQENYSDWDFASVTNTAGFLPIKSSGHLISAVSVQDGILVFSDNEAFLVSYQGQPFIYGQQRVGTDLALLSPNTVATYLGRAAWMGKTGFYNYQNGQISPLPCDISDIFERLTPIYSSLVSCGGANGLFTEVWWSVALDGSTVPNYTIHWNYVSNVWSISKIGRTAIAPAGVYRFPVMADTSNNVFQHESGWTAGGASRVGTIWAESSALSDGLHTNVLLNIECDSGHGYNSTQIKVYTRPKHDAAETINGPYVPQPNGLTPTRCGGQDMRIRVESTQDGLWSIGKLSANIRQAGSR
jgi:hypothetical protein